MKNLLLSASLLLLVSAHASAQQGTWMLFGNGNYDNMNYTPNGNNGGYPAMPFTLTGWVLNTGIGYMAGKNFMVGLQGGYGNQEIPAMYVYYMPYYSTDKIRVATWNASVFCRYTTALSKRFFVYAQFSAGKQGTDSKGESANNTNPTPPYNYPATASLPDGNGTVVSLFPAAGMNLIRGYGINLSIGGISYTTYNATNSPSDQHHFNVTLGQQFTFGIHKILGWQKLSTAPAAPAVAN